MCPKDRYRLAYTSRLIRRTSDASSAVEPAWEVRSSIVKSADRDTGNTACRTYRPKVARTSLKNPHSKSMALIYINLIGALLVHLQ